MKRVYLCTAIFAVMLALSLYNYIWTSDTLSEVTEDVRGVRTALALEDKKEADIMSASAMKTWRKLLSRQFLMSDKDGMPEITQLLSKISGGIGDNMKGVSGECDTALLLLELLHKRQRAVL